MKNISEFKLPTPEQSKKTERGELLKYFAGKINKPIGYVAMRLTGFAVKDMYYLKSLCDQEEKRGTPWGKAFFGSIKSHER